MPIVQIARTKTQRGQNVIVGEKEGFSKAYPWIMMHRAQGELETEPQYETFVSWLEKVFFLGEKLTACCKCERFSKLEAQAFLKEKQKNNDNDA